MWACTLIHVQLFVTLWTVTHQAPLSIGFFRQEYWSGLHFLPQGIFLTQELNLWLLCLLHCRWIIYRWAIREVLIEYSVQFSHSVVSDSLRPHRLQPTRLLCPWDSPGRNTGVGCHFLLQEIFPTKGSNLGLPYCRQTLYHLSHQGRNGWRGSKVAIF